MPQYAALTFTRDVDWTAPEQAGEMAEWNEFRDAAMASIRGGAALYPTATATTVRVSEKGGDVIATDGPYAETKEYLGGFWVIEAPDLDAALKIAAEASQACGGKVEVRPFAGE